MRKDSLNNKLENDFEILKEIFTVLKLTSKYYDKICKEFNITQVQFDVLYLLYISKDSCIKMSTLGDRLEMARSGVTILVDRMALSGLVKRRADVDDRRIINLMITEKGNEIMNEIFQRNGIFKVSTLDFIQQEEKELLCKLIINIKEKLESKVHMV